MKNFSKTLISMAAVMAVGSAMAVSAMANELSINTETLTSDGTITISNVTPNKSQYTLLVVQGTKADGAETYTYDANSGTIKQVDQNDLGKPFSSIALGTEQKDGKYKLDEGSYKVLVGNNDGSLDSGIFTVSSTPQVEYEEIIIGDVDASMNGVINSTDVGNILRASNNNTSRIGKCGTTRIDENGKTIIIGDVDASMNGIINSTDVGNILRASNNNTSRIGKCGTVIKVQK